MRQYPNRAAPGRSPTALAALLLALVLAGSATAQSTGDAKLAFNVSPLRIELNSGDSNTLFRVENESNAELALQARGFRWTQPDGSDSYQPTADFAITPSIVRVAPGKTQTFRVIRRTAAPAGAEMAYRVVLDQIPSSSPYQNIGAATRLRVTIPMFVGRDRAAPATMSWSTDAGAIAVANSGARTAKLQQLGLSTNGLTYPLGNGSQRYVLPKSRATWVLPAGLSCIAKGTELIGTIDGKSFREPAPATCR